MVQITPNTAQKPFRAHTNSAENCARPQKLSHARVTNDFLSTFLTHWNVRTQISNGCFYHFVLTDKYPPQKRTHLSVAILPLDISMNSYWFETETGKEHASIVDTRKYQQPTKKHYSCILFIQKSACVMTSHQLLNGSKLSANRVVVQCSETAVGITPN